VVPSPCGGIIQRHHHILSFISMPEKPHRDEELNYTAAQLKEVHSFCKINKDSFYEVLGIDRQASDTDIKKAYKKV